MQYSNVLVCGATGNQGTRIADLLLRRGHKVRALTRKPHSTLADRLRNAGAAIVVADFADDVALRAAMADIDAMFLMGTPYEAGIDAEVSLVSNAIDVAVECGVPHIVYSSGASVDQDTGVPHFDSKMVIERHLRLSGLPWTIIGPAFFMENFLSPLWLPGLKNGKLALALPPGRRIQMISLDQIAEFVVAAIEAPDRFSGVRLDIASDEIAGVDVAAVLSRLSGRPIDYVELPLSAMRELGEDFAIMFAWFDRVGYSVDLATLQREHSELALGSFATWAQSIDWRSLLAEP